MERDPLKSTLVLIILHFNSHAHVERDALKFYNDKTTLNFNSHAHVERDLLIYYLLLFVIISTHTLTWSVTIGLYSNDSVSTFQLTRSRGA